MEKFLWNLIGVLLLALGAMSLMYALLAQTFISCVILIAVAVVGCIYADKRPEWLEV